MTVTSSTNSASYAGNGVSTDFTVPFRFLDNSHLRVVLVDADGTEHVQVLNTDYTASGAGNATGDIAFSTAPASGKTVQIFRNVPITQEKDYVTGDKFPAESHEQALDKLTMIAQQQREVLDRAWTSPVGAPGDKIVAGAEGTVPKFDADGNLVEGPSAAEIENAEGYAEDAAQSATDAQTAQAGAETAETGAEAARDQAVAAASSVSPTEYPNIATAKALAPISAPNFIRTAGYAAAGDGGGALYKKVDTEPSHAGKFSIMLSDGETVVWYEIASNFRTPEMYGAKGDDIDNDGTGTDDLDALRSALGSGFPVYGRPGAIYRASDKVDMEDGTTLNLLGARINFYGDGKRCLSPKNNCVVEGGAVYNYGDTDGLSGDLQCPIAIGIFSGTGAGTGYHNVRVSNMEIGSTWDEGNGVIITGDSHNVVVENIKIPSGNVHLGVLVHWAGNTVSGTVHPHNIRISNIRIGELLATSRFSTYGVFLSGCYNVTVDDVLIDECGCSIQIYVGDYGETYTQEAELGLVNRGIVVSNVIAKECWSGPWVNGEAGVSGGQFKTDVKLVNCSAKCSVADSTHTLAYGLQFTGADGVSVEGGEFSGFYNGASFGGAVETNRHIKVKNTTLRDMYLSGFFGSLSVRPPEDIEIVGCRILDCNTVEATTALGSAIYVGGKRMTVQDNFISSEKSTNGVYVLSTATGSVVEHNYVDALVSGGVAYNINAATKGGGNSAASGITLHSGVPITDCLFGAATVDLASVAAGASVSQTVTVTGAALGDFVEAISSTTDLSGLSVTGEISAADTVRLWFYNNNDSTAVDLGSAAFTVLVRKRA